LDERIPNKNRKEISVLGLCRGRRYYVDNVPVDLIENVRLTRAYKLKILTIMSEREFSDGWWGNSQEECDDAVAFVKRWNEKYNLKFYKCIARKGERICW